MSGDEETAVYPYAPEPGSTVGPWLILERLDSGTFGGVYLPPCTDGGEPLDREVLPPSAMAMVCLEFEALTLRLLSEDRQARGTAEQLEREERYRRRPSFPAWLSLASAGLVSGLVVALAVLLALPSRTP